MKPGTRPAVALGLTALGLTLTLRFHTPPTRPVALSHPPPASRPLAGGSPANALPRGQVAGEASPAPTPSVVVRTIVRGSSTSSRPDAPNASPTNSPARTSPPSQPVRTYPCQTFQAGSYGPVQVEIKVQGSHWVDVVNLQLPGGDATTDGISANAGPQLRREALASESANIDNVSGATYTTYAYRQSLQSCIDQW